MVMTMVCVSMNAQRWTWDRVVAERNHRELTKSIDRLTEATEKLARTNRHTVTYDTHSSAIAASYINELVDIAQKCPNVNKVYVWNYLEEEYVEITDSTYRFDRSDKYYHEFFLNGKYYSEYPTEVVVLRRVYDIDFFDSTGGTWGNIIRHRFNDKDYKSLFKKHNLNQKKGREEYSNLQLKSNNCFRLRTKEDCLKAIAELQAFKEKYKEILKL